MHDEVNSRGRLYQEHAAVHIGVMFGDEFLYQNENGNWVLAPRVLAAFRRLTGDSVVWDRGERCCAPGKAWMSLGNRRISGTRTPAETAREGPAEPKPGRSS
jgi:uncharacterized protein DUF6953